LLTYKKLWKPEQTNEAKQTINGKNTMELAVMEMYIVSNAHVMNDNLAITDSQNIPDNLKTFSDNDILLKSNNEE